MPTNDLAPRTGDALVIVDLQNDFVTGSLAVPGASAVLAPVGRVVDLFRENQLPVAATRDWHPPDHLSFEAQGGPWPPHCVAGTSGADYAAGFRLPPATIHIRKATTPEIDAYSGFEGTPLASELRRREVTRVFVAGLATDYCVLNTVRDATAQGLDVIVLADAIRAVNVRPDDGVRAETAMREAGARFSTTDEVLRAADHADPSAE